MTTQQLIRAALAEDRARRDVTTRLTVPPRAAASGRLVARAAGVLAGGDVCARVFLAVDPEVRLTGRLRDGTGVRPGVVVARVSGPARSILSAERTALNFLQHLSGIATLTRRYVDAVRGTDAVILDTRKTTPGWRDLEKQAVRAGGGRNHRRDLSAMVLVKDNHIAAAGSLTRAIGRCLGQGLPVEVEVKTLAQLRVALDAGCRHILLDNMTPARLRRAVALTWGRAKLEASGGIGLKNVRRVAETGVDYISVGALTHSAPALDIALDLATAP